MPTNTSGLAEPEKSGVVLSSKRAAGQVQTNDQQRGLSEQPQTVVHEIQPARGLPPSAHRAVLEAQMKSDKPVPTPDISGTTAKEDDFGFTFEAPPEIKTVNMPDFQNAYKQTKETLTNVVSIFNTLLDKLAQNPEQQFIKWPNRVEQINKVKAQLQDALKG